MRKRILLALLGGVLGTGTLLAAPPGGRGGGGHSGGGSFGGVRTGSFPAQSGPVYSNSPSFGRGSPGPVRGYDGVRSVAPPLSFGGNRYSGGSYSSGRSYYPSTGFSLSVGIPLGGYGYGGYRPYRSGYGYGGYYGGTVIAEPVYTPTYVVPYTETVVPAQPIDPVASVPSPLPSTPTVSNKSSDYAAQGRELLAGGKAKEAVAAFRHAAVDDPKNGTLIAYAGQALYAIGQFDEASGAAQQALSLIPEDKWQTELTPVGKAADLTNLNADLRKQIEKAPTDPGPRFLAGYQSFVQGDYKQSVSDLDVLLTLVKDDPLANKLRDSAAKLSQ